MFVDRKLARILKIDESDYGNVRLIGIKTSTSMLRRSIIRIIVIFVFL